MATPKKGDVKNNFYYFNILYNILEITHVTPNTNRCKLSYIYKLK